MILRSSTFRLKVGIVPGSDGASNMVKLPDPEMHAIRVPSSWLDPFAVSTSVIKALREGVACTIAFVVSQVGTNGSKFRRPTLIVHASSEPDKAARGGSC